MKRENRKNRFMMYQDRINRTINLKSENAQKPSIKEKIQESSHMFTKSKGS